MKIIAVDHNATAESGAIRLDYPMAQESLVASKSKLDDWVWISDGEVLVGAELQDDPIYGLVAMPHWETVVNLDDYDEVDWPSFRSKLGQLLERPDHAPAAEAELFQMLIVFDQLAIPELRTSFSRGHFSMRAAGALHRMGEPGLALTLMEQAIAERPHDPAFIAVHLDHLRRLDPARAEVEARSRGSNRLTHATVLAACINVLAATTDRLGDADFRAASEPILDWIDRFDAAPGRDQVRPAVLASVHLNQGLLLLRQGQREAAWTAFARAQAADPAEPDFDRFRDLEAYNANARAIADEVRRKLLPSAA